MLVRWLSQGLRQEEEHGALWPTINIDRSWKSFRVRFLQAVIDQGSACQAKQNWFAVLAPHE